MSSRKRGLSRLQQLRQETNEAEQRLESQRARFVRLARNDSAPRAVSSFNLFQTPAPVAADMVAALVDHFGSLDGLRILEPSAGLGRLYRAVRDVSTCEITLVEQSPDCCRELYDATEADSNATLIQDDFLSVDVQRVGGLVDAVIMNSPWKRGLDCSHLKHAFSMLKPNGILVGLCFDGVKQNKVLKPWADTWEPLPENTFKAEGTKAGGIMITKRVK